MVRVVGEESDSSCEILESPPPCLVESRTRKRRKARRCASGFAGHIIDRAFVTWFFREDPAKAHRAGDLFDSLQRRGASSREWIASYADLMSSDSSDDDSHVDRYQMGKREFATRADHFIVLPEDASNEAVNWVDREVLGIPSYYALKHGDSCMQVEILAAKGVGVDQAEESGSGDEVEEVVFRDGSEEEEEEDPYRVVAPTTTDRVCHNTGEKDRNLSFFMYETYFRKIGIRLPFTLFEMAVLNHLMVAPSQLHPNAWGFIKAFEVFTRVRSMPCTVNLFFWLFCVRHSTNKDEDKAGRRGWTILQAQNGCALFSPFHQSYKD